MPDDRPAGFWRRAVALAVDLAVVSLSLRIGQLLTDGLRRHDLAARAFLGAWIVVVPAAYFVLAHGTTGQSLGKWLMRARVVGVDGAAIGYARALGRAVAWIVAATLGIGLLAVAWRRDGRGWHDRLAGTRVVRLS